MTIDALRAIKKNQWSLAQEKIAQSRDPLAAKLFLWLMLVEKNDTGWSNQLFGKLSDFIRKNPEWPDVARLRLRAEKVMPASLSPSDVVEWYQDYPPQTPSGMSRFMNALITLEKTGQARAVMANWWEDASMSREDQVVIHKRFGQHLTTAAHKRRLDALLFNRQYSAAREIADLLGNGYPELAEARIALAENKNGVDKMVKQVPPHLLGDAGLMYERLKWRRTRGNINGALEILQNAPTDPDLIKNPAQWWTERQIIVRGLLSEGHHEDAYDLLENHVQQSGLAYAEAQWLTGWIALRFVNKPTAAFERFTAMYQGVNTPISKSRAAYWSGRAAKALRQEDQAQIWYRRAAEYQTAFYGQLAAAELSLENELPKTKLPYISKEVRNKYQEDELIQAAALFKEINDHDRANNFIDAFLENDSTPKAYRFAAEKMAEQGDYKQAVKIAKRASHKDLFLTKQSFPTITKHLQGIHETEWALIHAIIRQESMFDFNAKSSAGALGLMQLMPATAREVSGKLSLGYKKSWLTERPKYNIALGSAYITELIKRYDGSYPLAIAAYNAGPTRVNQWLRFYGDPRKDELSLIDWMEMIPISETRNYVQRVLENVYVYRLRLNNIQKEPIHPIHVALNLQP